MERLERAHFFSQVRHLSLKAANVFGLPDICLTQGANLVAQISNGARKVFEGLIEPLKVPLCALNVNSRTDRPVSTSLPAPTPKSDATSVSMCPMVSGAEYSSPRGSFRRMRSTLAALALIACGVPQPNGGTGGGTNGTNGTGGNTGTGGGTGGTGGGSNVPGIDREELSGSRLKNRYIEGDDGSRTLTGYFDSARNEDCFFTQAEDGRFRCLPIENAANVSPANSVGPYGDSSCTQLLASGNCDGARYGTQYNQVCPYRVGLYSVTAFSGSMIFYKTGTGGACQPGTMNPNLYYFNVGAKLDMSLFVGGTQRHE